MRGRVGLVVTVVGEERGMMRYDRSALNLQIDLEAVGKKSGTQSENYR
jgi:hypothetical protein